MRIRLSLKDNMDKFSMVGAKASRRDIKKERLMDVLKKAADDMLTDRQYKCFMMYFCDEKSMKEIAAEVGISPSTVSRHIKAARVKLSKLNYLL